MHQSVQDMITSAERIARALAERDTPPGRPINQTEVYRHRIAALERIVRDLAGGVKKAQPDPQKDPQPDDYAALDLEHLGDPQKGKGIYAEAIGGPWKDHQTVQLVNALRDCAIKYHATEQLRAQIAELVAPVCESLQRVSALARSLSAERHSTQAGEDPPQWLPPSMFAEWDRTIAAELNPAMQPLPVERDASGRVLGIRVGATLYPECVVRDIERAHHIIKETP